MLSVQMERRLRLEGRVGDDPNETIFVETFLTEGPNSDVINASSEEQLKTAFVSMMQNVMPRSRSHLIGEPVYLTAHGVTPNLVEYDEPILFAYGGQLYRNYKDEDKYVLFTVDKPLEWWEHHIQELIKYNEIKRRNLFNE